MNIFKKLFKRFIKTGDEFIESNRIYKDGKIIEETRVSNMDFKSSEEMNETFQKFNKECDRLYYDANDLQREMNERFNKMRKEQKK